MDLKPVVPFEPIAAGAFPQGNEWIAQIKWDGVRMLSYFDGRSARLINRRRNDRTMQYPEFADPTEYCSASSFILDGEFIAFDEARPSFHEIMRRDSLRTQAGIFSSVSKIPVSYMVFDVLYSDGHWRTDRPLRERQKLLEDIIAQSDRVQICRNFDDPAALFELMKARRMEGIVCKSLDSAYGLGRKDGRWRKLKTSMDLYAAVGGVTFNGPTVNSLLLGLFDEKGSLYFIGYAGAGKLKQEEWRKLTERIPDLTVSEVPFSERPERNKDVVWVKPRLVAKVRFMNWTEGRTMRQPSIQALLPERFLGECVVGQIGAQS